MERWHLVGYLINLTGTNGTIWASLLMAGGIILCMVIPYILGSFNFGLIISRAKYHDDIRKHGSGNAGTTNMLRTYGKKAAVLTLLGDMLKAVLAVLVGYLVLHLERYDPETGKMLIRDSIGAAIASISVIVGHMFPCFYKFKGGKGVATGAMVILMLHPIVFLICVGTFAIIVAGTKYVSLASIISAALFPLVFSAFTKGAFSCLAAVIIAVLIIWRHKENIRRLRDGKESKLSFKKKPAVETAAEATTETKADFTVEVPKSEEEAPQHTASKPVFKTEKPVEIKLEDEEFALCATCGRLIPRARKVCLYCKTENANYDPSLVLEETPKKAAKGKHKKK